MWSIMVQQPVQCLRWLMVNAGHVVRGNHDNALGYGVGCRCMGTFREYSVATRDWHRTLLSEADCEFLRQMLIRLTGSSGRDGTSARPTQRRKAICRVPGDGVGRAGCGPGK